MKKYKLKYVVNNKEKIKFAGSLEDAEKKFNELINTRRKHEATIFLMEHTIGEHYKIIKLKVILKQL